MTEQKKARFRVCSSVSSLRSSLMGSKNGKLRQFVSYYGVIPKRDRSHRVDGFMIHREQPPHDRGGGPRKALPGWSQRLGPPSLGRGAGLFLVECFTANPRLMRDKRSGSTWGWIAGR